MRLRYFIVDGESQLRKAPQAVVQALWDGTRRASALGCPSASELRLVSVVCDDDLLPRKVFLLRLPLCGGVFTAESRLTLRMSTWPDCVTPAELACYHICGWPADFYRQLAVALDVPVRGLDVPLGVGGPLLLAAASGLTPSRAARRLR